MNRSLLIFMLAFVLCAGLAAAQDASPGYVMRYADIGGGNIVFTYEGDLWLVPEGGGDARRITSHPGNEQSAKFSPDGSLLAFTASYDGGNDVYVMDARGGVPRRLTYHPAGDTALEWAPDGKSVYFRTNRSYPFRGQIYQVSVDGGMPTALPIDRGSLGSPAPDGSAFAYNRIGRQARTWKRYEGGMAQDVWVLDQATGDIRKITEWSGTDSFPMWEGSKLYYISDREDGTLNIYSQDPAGGDATRLTEFKTYDVKYPSNGDGKIVFQHGSGIKVLDLAGGQVSDVAINIPSDRRHVREELVQANPRRGSFRVSPGGERAILEDRGEIISIPSDDGDAFNLTRSSGSREKSAVWSPDGKWIALVSDRSGEEQIYLLDQRGEKEWRQLTKGTFGFMNQPVWSPDSKSLIFSDKFMKLYLVDVAAGKVKEIAHSDYDDAWERWGIMDYVWSPDSRWIAYTNQTGNMNEAIHLYDTKSGKDTKVTGDMTNDWSPSFSGDGKHLYFLSNRTFNPIMGRQDQTHVFLKMAKPYVVLLQDGGRSPFYAEDAVVVVDPGDEKKDDGKKEDKKKESMPEIDVEGIGERILVCPGVEPDNYFRLTAVEGGFLMLRKNDPEFLKYQNVDDSTGGSLDLVNYSLEDEELSDLMSGLANYHLSADGSKLIYRAGRSYGIVDTGKPAKSGDGKVNPGAVKLRIDQLAEFEQIFTEAWRIQRDWFYDKNMHGVDWQGMYDKYAPFVAGCGTRGDLNYLIGEMIAELNIGHTYIFGGDMEDGPDRVSTGLLGCDFVTDGDRYRFANIVPGVNWDPRYRSPLTEPGVGIGEGDYLIAVDGIDVKAGDNVWMYLVDRARDMVSLTTSAKADGKGATTVRVQALGSEFNLRYRAWVDGNLDYVTDKADGKIGYVHVPNMMDRGLVEFGRSYYPQTNRPAMIIDERYNGGGFVGDQIIDRLERVMWAITIPREGKSGRNPERVHHGPVVVLINEDTGSNGEFFAEAIKRMGLAEVVGMRTWGGSIGIEPHQDLMDGGGTTPPQFGMYTLDGQWPIEGWGVEPDIVVMNMPKDVVDGKDAQLDFAIQYLLDELKNNPGKWDIPGTPAYPDKSRPYMSGPKQ